MATFFSKIRSWLTHSIKHPLLLAVGGLGILVALMPFPAYASVQGVFGDIFFWFATFLSKLTLQLIGLLVQVVQYNDFINAPAVVKGWVVVRDTVNMFFIVVLLAIAFGTVFRMEEYQYKQVLGKLLTMAVLVNFSKSIAGFFIDFSQVIMLTFVNGFKDAAAGNFISGFHMDQMFQFANLSSSEAQAQAGDPSVYFYASVFSLVLIAITTVVVGVYLIIFLLRIVALWFLIVISPLAFLLNAWPGKGHEYHQEWWEYFGKYASTGPILAFFLWLSLAVMQFSSDTAKGFLVKGSTGLDIPAATVVGISQSDVLLSFIISITMLVGGLWMASKLGVAGGSLAGGALNAIQRVGTSPLRGLAKGGGMLWKGVKGAAKGSARWGWQEVGSRLGIETSLEKWKEGWQAGKHKRAEARRVIQQKKYGENVKNRSRMQFLGSPEHLFEHQWNTKTIKAIAKGGGLQGITGKAGDEVKGSLDGVNAQIKNTEEALGPNLGEQYRGELKGEAQRISKETGELGKQYRDVGKEATTQITEKGKPVNDLETKAKAFEQDADVLDHDTALLENQAVTLEGRATTLEGTGVAADAEQAVVLRKQADEFRKKADKTSTQADKKRTEASTATNQANKLRTKSQPEIDHITNQRDRTLSSIQTKIDSNVVRYRGLMGQTQQSDAVLDTNKRAEITHEVTQAEAEAQRIEVGGLSEKQQKTRDTQIDTLTKALNELRAQMAAQPPGTNQVAEQAREREFNEKITKLRNPAVTEEEKRENKDLPKELREKAKELRIKLEAKPLSVAERAKLKADLEQLKHQKHGLEEQYHLFKPAEDYGIRRNQREAIDAEKSKMTTDNWQELVQIAKDAIHAGDAHRAAAAYLKATEFGNENEFQNSFGFDSDAQGLKDFVEEVFENQLKMSHQQALSIGSDVSYAGEKIRHWMVARAVVTNKDGQLDWQKENNRQIECLAEIRKVDPEGFVRNANRLAFFKERVGGEGLRPDATREEKAEYFQRTQNRYSVTTPMVEAYLVENMAKFKQLLGRGRFNDSIAINVSMGNNFNEILRSIRENGKLSAAEYTEFEDTMKEIRKAAGQRGNEQFGTIKRLMGIS